MHPAMRDAMSPKRGNMPTLADLKKKIPPGGLLNPGLRAGTGKVNYAQILKSTVGRKGK